MPRGNVRGGAGAGAGGAAGVAEVAVDEAGSVPAGFAGLVLAVAPLAAPFLAASHPLAALLIRSFFSRICHQDPTRSFLVEGSPVAVCVRCLGIYCGTALAAWLRVGRAFATRLLVAALLINLLDVASGALHWHGSLPLVRLLLGLLLGLGAGTVVFLPEVRLTARLSLWG